jgi:hypothetical protein
MTIELPAPIQTVLPFFHPVLMWAVFAIALYALYLGIKVKRTRQAEGAERKELIKGRFNVKHYQVGSLLLALMVMGTIGGMAVTYISNGKLFVGPHLLVGLGMTGLVAVSAALSPLMQQGQMWARYTHIGLNLLLLGLFSWQALTGVQIVQKIISNM